MKAVESKQASSTTTRTASPFFSKESDQHFFGSNSQVNSFFPANHANSSSIQRKLNVGQPNDHYEKEADSMADQVIQRISQSDTIQTKPFNPSPITPFVQKKCTSCEEEKAIQKLEEKEDPSAEVMKLQKKPIFESNAEPPDDDKNIQRKCAECAKEEDLQRKEEGRGVNGVTPELEANLNSTKGAGNPLPEQTKSQMESSIGADFSNVRIHDDSNAAKMSKDLHAQAFTHGNDIYFNTGKYDTSSSSGQHLLAHELTHTVQQGGTVRAKSSSVIQKNGSTPDPNQAPVSNIPGPPYEKDGYKLANDKGTLVLTVPKVSLPAFKNRNSQKFKKPIAFMAGRIDSNQVSNWKENVKTDVGKSTDEFLKDKSKSVKGDVYFFKGQGDFVIFGKAEKLKRDFQIPEWDRKGLSRDHAVDHIVELQLGGSDGPDNYELLESIANSSIGSVIQKEIYKRIRDGVKLFKDNNVPGVPTFRELTRKDSPVALVFFTDIDQWNLKPSKGDPDLYWSITEVKDGTALKQLQPMTIDEIHKLEGSDKKLYLFVKPGEGKPHEIELPAKKQPNWIPGIDLLSVNITNSSASDDAVMGSLDIAIQPEIAKKIGAPASITLPFTKIGGLVNAGALVFSGVADKIKGLFPGLSPLKFTSFDLNDNGLLITGTITAENPLIEDASIDFSISGKELRLSKTFSLGELKGLPSFLKVTDVSLGVFASTEFGFGVEGDIDFEIGQIGKGSLHGEGATANGFAVSGEFNFNSKKFKGSKVWFKYMKKEWSGGGTIAVTDMTGVEKGQLTIEYKDKQLTAQGDAKLKIPGIDTAKLKAVFDKDGGMDITGSVELKKLPGVKGGSVTVHISKTADRPDYNLLITGEVEPNLPQIPNLNAKMVVSYDNGLFKAEVIAKYAKGKLEGDVTIGITNGIVDDEGKVQKAEEGAIEIKFYGNGSITITLIKSLTSQLSVFINTKGEILLSADIKIHSSPFDPIKKSIDLFHIDKNIPLIGIPFANVFLKIGAGASAYLEWEPLVIDFETSLKKTPLEEIKKGKLGGTTTLKIHSIAKAGIQLDVKVGAGVAVTVLALSANVTGSVGVGIKGDAGADIEAEWDSEKGFKFKEADFKVEIVPQAILALKGTIEAELDLIVSSVKIYTYNLGEAKREIDIKGLSFKGELPVTFDDTGAVKKADFEKLVPKFDAASGERMLKQAITGEDTPAPDNQDETAKTAIKNQINADLKAKLSAKESNDIVLYAASLQRKYTNVADQKLRTFVLAAIESEMRSVANDEFDKLKNELRLSKDPLATKLQKITDFEKRFYPFANTEDTAILRSEFKQLESQQTVQKKPIFDSENEEDKIQKKPEGDNGNSNPTKEPNSGAIKNTEGKIQRFPQAGEVLPATDKQARYYKYRNEIVPLLGSATFQPSAGLGNYIGSMWENASEPAINVSVGSLGEGFIYVKKGAHYFNQSCEEIIDPIYLCTEIPPPVYAYQASKQVIPITHPAFAKSNDGTLVYVVEITNGFIHGSLGWIQGKNASNIDPLLDADLAQTSEEVFLPLIYGKEYDGANYSSSFFNNESKGGSIYFHTIGILQLPNQQKIEGLFIINDERYQFKGDLIGKPEGLDAYDATVTRTPDALITAETSTLNLDFNWTSGDPNSEHGVFKASSQLRLSYRNHILEVFGTAKYASERLNGEVNISVTTKSKADKIFAEHASSIAKEKKGVSGSGTSNKENPEEPLALTAWGDLNFRIINTESKVVGAKKSPIENLEGKGSFVVSSDGYIILAGEVKFPTKWKLTKDLEYKSTDPENKDKHLFKYKKTIVEAWVPEALGTVEVNIGITADVLAHLNPLELYEIEVSGVYSNHPKFRSEVNLTPKFFLSGYATASATLEAEGSYKCLGLIKTASFTGEITGTARLDANIDAAPTITRIWGGYNQPATYGLSGIIRAGGGLTFTLTGSFHLKAFGVDLLDSEDYHIGSWTLKTFSLELKLNEYILGSGEKPDIDYGKMGINDSQRKWFGQSITEEIKDKGGPKHSGGFEQKEEGKMEEKGKFSEGPPPPRPDHDKDIVDNRIDENFLMGNKLHDLVIIIGGTRKSPTSILKMASGPEKPLVEKIEAEKEIVELEKDITSDPIQQRRLDTQLRDLQSIEVEAVNIEKNARETAHADDVKDPKVAGFDQIDDHIADYAQKYNRDDLGVIAPTSTGPVSPTTPTSTPPPLPTSTPSPGPAIPSTPSTPTSGGTTDDLKKLKVGDLLSAPYKNGRAKAEVLEITKEFVTILIKSKSRSSDIRNMIPRSRFKDMLDDGDIFIWSELRQYLMSNRPKYVTGLVDQVWNNARAISSDGKVRDPNPPYEILTWHRSQSRWAQWHMGHRPGHKYSDLVDQLVNEEISWDEFIEEYNTPANYYPELPSKNMGHGFEEAEQEP